MRSLHRPVALVLAVAASATGVVACGRGGAGARSPDPGAFRGASPGSAQDPTVRPARLVPEEVDDAVTYGSEAAGGVRLLSGGLRLVSSREGALVAASDRLPQPPQMTAALPERLGGGFLFLLGSTVWRADKWLAPAAPVFTSAAPVQGIVPGLDRVYLRTPSGYVAIDGQTGKLLDRGPWPASPNVTSYAAADGWRAVATADLRGVVATFDAGATWRTLDLALDPRAVVASGDALAVGGVESGRAEAWFEVRADGSIARLAAAPRDAKVTISIVRPPPTPGTPGVPRPPFPPGWPGSVPWPQPTGRGPVILGGGTPIPQPPPRRPEPEDDTTATHDGERTESAREGEPTFARIFGRRPIAAAIEDGWPLTDGTAVVARDGALGRVRLSDGAILEVATGAFPLKPARCHPVSLTRPSAAAGFGFVCGEPRGATVLYAYEPLRGRLAELKRFDRPRVVTSSGNGALAVRGGCAEDADPGTGDGTHAYCILGRDAEWREVHVRGDVAGERVVVLADGRLAVISPPPSVDAPARLTLLDKGKATTVPIVFPRVTPDVARVLRLGMWLEGFEERRPGVIGGWLEANGSMLGLEIATDGKTALGQYLRDAGQVFVSGRYGLGWVASRRGYETTDGGMTWTPLELPDAIAPRGTAVPRRACGPVGCLASGWVRVGWGEPRKAPLPAAPPVTRTNVALTAPSVTLACEPLASSPPAPPVGAHKAPVESVATKPTVGRFGGPPVLSPSPQAFGTTDLPPFYTQPPPVLRDGERGQSFDVTNVGQRAGAVARLYAWGPKTGEWDTLGRWQVRWMSPFAGWTETKSSVAALPPGPVVDVARAGSPYGYGGYSFGTNSAFSLVPGDDTAHAMLMLRRTTTRPELWLYELEAERAPVEIRRSDGEPFADVDAVVRTAGRWFVATTSTVPMAAGAPTTTIWQVDGAVAREMAHIARVGLESGRQAAVRLARRSDGRALGFVVDGQPTPERAVAVRWVLPIDLETGALGEPESLGYEDLGGLALDSCADDAVGWIVDTNISNATVRIRVGANNASVHQAMARVRLTGSRACFERISGMLDSQSPERAAMLAKPGARGVIAPRPGEIGLAATAAQSRYPLRCTIAK